MPALYRLCLSIFTAVWVSAAFLCGTAAEAAERALQPSLDGLVPVLVGRVVASGAVSSVLPVGWDSVESPLASSALVRLSYFVRGERGDEKRLVHDLRRGRAHLGLISLAGLVETAAELELALLPGLFDSPAEAEFVFRDYLFELSDELLARKGLRLLNWVTHPQSVKTDRSFMPIAVIVNREWFDAATAAQQAILRNAGSSVEPVVNPLSIGSRPQSAALSQTLSRSPAVFELTLEQQIERIGGRADDFYSALYRGKTAYVMREGSQ